MQTIDAILRIAPVIPVLVLDDAAQAEGLAQILVAAGLPVLEVTLRTAAALDIIRAMSAVPGAVVGAGTILTERQLHDARRAGARFAVSPALTHPLVHAARTADMPYLPGIATAADIMRGLDLGLDRFKFFPAEAVGGLPGIRAYASVFPDIRFCPTGGITAARAADWLAERSVLCVGGSWLVPPGQIQPEVIRARAEVAAALRR